MVSFGFFRSQQQAKSDKIQMPDLAYVEFRRLKQICPGFRIAVGWLALVTEIWVLIPALI